MGRRWAAILAIATVFGAALGWIGWPSSASGADPWSPPADLETDSGGGAPRVGVDAAGNVIAFWARNGWRAARFDVASKSWSPSVLVGPGGEQHDLAVDPAGNAFAVWQAGLGSGTPARIEAARYDAATATWAPPVVVANGLWPAIAVDAAGNAIAIFLGGALSCPGGNCSGELNVARYDAATATWSAGISLGTGKNPIFTDIAFDASGDAMAVWTDRDELSLGATKWVRAKRYDATSGTWGATATLSAASGEPFPGLSKIDVAPNGDATAVWLKDPDDQAPFSIRTVRAARYTAATDAWAAAEDVGQTHKTELSIDVAVDAGGSSNAVWVDDSSIVQTSHRPAAGPWGPPVALSGIAHAAVAPHVDSSAAGSGTIVWARSSGAPVQASRRDPATGTWLAAEDVSTGTGTSPRVAIDPAGRSTTVWSGGAVQASRHPNDIPPPTTTSSTTTTTTTTTTTQPAAPAGFHAVAPTRVFDTRPGESADAKRLQVAKQKVGGAYVLEVQFTDLAGVVPASGVAAVSMNLAVTNPEGSGFATAYPCGERQLVANVNYVAGQTVSNAVIVPVSPTGTVCFYSLVPADLIADLNGWFAAGSGFGAVTPSRVFDTRPGESPNAVRAVSKTKVGGDTVLRVRLADMPGLTPATGVAAVSLNVAVTNPERAGFVTLFPCGTRNLVASLNYDAGETISNAVIAPVSSDDGSVCFYSLAPVDLVVDVNGYFTGGSTFAAVTPTRVFDTRVGESPSSLREVPKVKVSPTNVVEVKLADLPGITPATGVAAVSLNVAVTNPDAAGFLTLYPCGVRPLVASVNYARGGTLSNAVIAPVSASGTVCFYSLVPTDVIVDVNGWFPS